MWLARRDLRRDQPSIEIGEIPPYSDPNLQQRWAGELVPKIGGFCAVHRPLALTLGRRSKRRRTGEGSGRRSWYHNHAKNYPVR